MTTRAILEAPISADASHRAPRYQLRLLGVRANLDEADAPALVHSLSAYGLLAEAAADLRLGESLWVAFPKGGVVPATVVWSSDRLFGCRFNKRLSPAVARALPSPKAIPNGLQSEVMPPQMAAAQFLPERMRYLREQRKLSRLMLAARVGVSGPTVWAWEIGRKTPRSANLKAVADALGVAESQLMSDAVVQYPVIDDEMPGDGMPLSANLPSRSGGLDNLPGFVSHCRQRIALLAGVECRQVKVAIEY